MQTDEQSQKPWLTQDFVKRFYEALGREMRPEERKFFGLEPSTSDDDTSNVCN